MFHERVVLQHGAALLHGGGVGQNRPGAEIGKMKARHIGNKKSQQRAFTRRGKRQPPALYGGEVFARAVNLRNGSAGVNQRAMECLHVFQRNRGIQRLFHHGGGSTAD